VLSDTDSRLAISKAYFSKKGKHKWKKRETENEINAKTKEGQEG
jgi:hypothetical protein